MTPGSHSGSLLTASVSFPGEDQSSTLRLIPAQPGVFALYGPPSPDGTPSQPYLTRAADLRRRIARLLAPPELAADGTIVRSKRLNLRERVARIDYTVTGSEWESVLVLYRAAYVAFGPDEARRRLRLHTPFFVRFAAENAFPRLYVTNRLSRRALATTYGPFPSRAAAERYCDAVLDLFKLRRCHEELTPAPDHPGCIYGEMNKCLRPCQRAQAPEAAAEYTAEAATVRRLLDTRGESLVISIGLEREEASAAMNFERAAELHAQWQKVRTVQSLADELTQPIPRLRALIVQHAAEQGSTSSQPSAEIAEGSVSQPGTPLAPSPTIAEETTQRAALYLVEAGCIYGPELLSTLGVRAVREQTAVGSSLFAQPLMLQAVPLPEDAASHSAVILSEAPEHGEGAQSKDPEAGGPAQTAPPRPAPAAPLEPTLSPETRAQNVVAALEAQVSAPADLTTLSDHLSILRRWYYRPEKQRAGEVFLPDANAQWPIRRILNGAARVALGTPARMAETQRDLAQRNPADESPHPAKTKVLHAGRPDVERIVPVLDKPAPFRSRRTKPQQD